MHRRQSELFGPPEDGKGTNGFDTLRKLDANHDGRLDDQDPTFESLVLWFDRDQDKSCSKSELMTLEDAGITSIDLAYTYPGAEEHEGFFEGETSTLKLRDGKRARIIDVYLKPM